MKPLNINIYDLSLDKFISLEKRFLEKVNKLGLNDCWEWTASTNKGYGRIGLGGSNGPLIYAHRIAYMLQFGWIEDSLIVLHKCDNRKCCNPSHLFLGTDKDNSLDRDNKNRNIAYNGEKCGASKLTEKDILEIRKDYRSSRKIAKDYNVTKTNILSIKNYKTWKHI